MNREQDYVHQIREANKKANKAAQRLFWDPVQKRIRPMKCSDPDSSAVEITKPDLGHSAELREHRTVITLFEDIVKQSGSIERRTDLKFHRWDDGQAYTQVKVEENAGYTVPGILHISKGNKSVNISEICADDFQVCVLAEWHQDSSKQKVGESGADGEWSTRGYVREDGQWQEASVQVMPLQKDLYSRVDGIFDTDIISDSCVFVAGLGSVGSFVAELLAMSGIGNFILLDHDRVEAANICRINAHIADIGRYKTKVAAERIYSKNPFATVETHELKITRDRQEFLRERVRRSDVVIGSVDNRDPRVILNRLCVEENKPLILMGAFHRAFGVQIFFMRESKVDPCYVCYLMSRPAEAKKNPLSSLDQGHPVPYADRPVPEPEPGLCVDISPMSTMTAKLCINELLKGKPTSMRSLDEDLIAPWYIYLNRREGPYEELEPLAFNVGDGMHILSWFGIELQPNPACPVCGNYVREMSEAHGISLS